MMTVDFDQQSYWHQRFSHETSFEWLLPSSQFMDILRPHLSVLPLSARILHLGSGTSDLQNRFRKDGFCKVTNVDYEPLAAERGRQFEEQAFGDVRMRYAIADATQLRASGDFSKYDEKFDLAVDKSTADAIACGGEAALLSLARSVRECLTDGAVWISMSFSATRFDVANLPFAVEIMAKVPTPKLKPTDPDIFHWCYLLRPR